MIHRKNHNNNLNLNNELLPPSNYCAFQQHTNDQMLLVLLNDNKKIKKTYHYKFL
jgi:hypothetical protein